MSGHTVLVLAQAQDETANLVRPFCISSRNVGPGAAVRHAGVGLRVGWGIGRPAVAVDRPSGCGGRCLLQASAAPGDRAVQAERSSPVTNVAAWAREFAAKVGGTLVYKSLSTGVLTAVGDQFFAVAVHADSPEAESDWRSRYDDLRYEVCETPGEVRRGGQAYLREFSLTFGAFDFSVTPDGRWWFLECNPAGQWGWIAERRWRRWG